MEVIFIIANVTWGTILFLGQKTFPVIKARKPLLPVIQRTNIVCQPYIPTSEDFSPQSPESVLGFVGINGSTSDFGLGEGTSPLCLTKRRNWRKQDLLSYRMCREMIKPFQSVCVTSQVHVQEGEQKRHISRRTSGLAMEQEACRAALVGGCLVCLSLEGGSASWAGPAVLQALMVCDRVSACRLREQRGGEDERRNPVIPSCKSKHSDVFLGFEALTLGPEIQSPPH